MKVRQLEIENFRGVRAGKVVFADNTLLVGGNNVGKSTVCEALDLVLGPERTSRRPVVDEHDFHRSTYVDADKKAVPIIIRAVVVDLSDEARRRFGGHLRRWNDTDRSFVDDLENGAEHADDEGVTWALPVSFRARYDAAEDDFEADTFFEHPLPELDELDDERRVHSARDAIASPGLTSGSAGSCISALCALDRGRLASSAAHSSTRSSG